MRENKRGVMVYGKFTVEHNTGSSVYPYKVTYTAIRWAVQTLPYFPFVSVYRKEKKWVYVGYHLMWYIMDTTLRPAPALQASLNDYVNRFCLDEKGVKA